MKFLRVYMPNHSLEKFMAGQVCIYDKNSKRMSGPLDTHITDFNYPNITIIHSIVDEHNFACYTNQWPLIEYVDDIEKSISFNNKPDVVYAHPDFDQMKKDIEDYKKTIFSYGATIKELERQVSCLDLIISENRQEKNKMIDDIFDGDGAPGLSFTEEEWSV